MVNEKKGKIETGEGLNDVYFLKIGKIRYLKSKNYKKNCCQICGKRRKTTAHHLIPRRLKCICPHLAEIRVRVCSECDEGFHPENKFIRESDVVKRQSKNISNLREAVQWRDNKIRKLKKGIRAIIASSNGLLNLEDKEFYIKRKEEVIEKEVIEDGK